MIPVSSSLNASIYARGGGGTWLNSSAFPDTPELQRQLFEWEDVIPNPDLCSFQSPRRSVHASKKLVKAFHRALTIKSMLVNAAAMKIVAAGRANPLFTYPVAVTSSCPSLIFKSY